MNTVLGIIVLILTLPAWLGQVLSALSPAAAVRFGLTEAEADVDPVFHADVRGEAWWDSITLWALPAGCLLMLLDQSCWTLFSLAGGGMYVYFAGRGIFQRVAMRRRGISVGESSTVVTAYVALILWGLGAGSMIFLAGKKLLN